jgi:serine/threonine-protein kinase HipA
MSRSAKVYIHGNCAGIFRQDENGYSFTYDPNYIKSKEPLPISLTLPLRKEPYRNKIMIPFFDGLIPDSWLTGSETIDISSNSRDRMSLLLSLCKDCTGAVSIIPVTEVGDE